MIGPDEIPLITGLAFVGYGLWLTPWKPAAFIVPGAVLLWISVPSRHVFIVRTPEKPPRRED